MQGTWPAINRSIGKREISRSSKGRCGTWEVRTAPQVVSYKVAAFRCRVLSASATMRARPVGLAVYNQRCAATACQRPIVVCLYYDLTPAALSCTDQKGVRPYPYGNKAPVQPLFSLQGSCVTELGQGYVNLPRQP